MRRYIKDEYWQDTGDEVTAWKKNTGSVFSRQERSGIISIIKGWLSAKK
jgi:hypothetical protein